jgi:hypothetical protein
MSMRTKSWDDVIFQIVVNGFLLFILIVVAIPLLRLFIMSITPLSFLTDKYFGMYVPFSSSSVTHPSPKPFGTVRSSRWAA